MQQPQSTDFRPISETLQEPLSETVDAICATHGAYKSRVTTYEGIGDKPLVVRGQCPACRAESQERDDARRQAERAAERDRRIAALLGRSGIPARFVDRSFANYVATAPGQKVALGVCRAYAESWPEKSAQGASIVLTGSPGTGKTHLACAIGNKVLREHFATVLFATVSAMLRAIKETYRKDSQRTEQEVIDRLAEPNLLIVDEVGVQVGSEHEKLLMFEVLNERYQNLRPTILISNLSVDELETFLGHRVMDRYRECGSVLAFDWESHRGSA